MSQPKHTPGPWHNTEHFSDDKHDGHLIVSDGGCNVANIWHAKHIATPDRIAEQDANAKLIAAAPEMYAALEEIEALTAPLCQAGDPLGLRIRAIATKARGGPN